MADAMTHDQVWGVEPLDALESHWLVCAVCLYSPSPDQARPAITVIEGYAVCEEHLGHVAQGTRFAGIYEAVQREEAAGG